MEGVQEGQAQLGADGTSVKQVLCQLVSAEGATPGDRDAAQHDWSSLPQTMRPGIPRSLISRDLGSQGHSPLAGRWVEPVAGKGEVA
jgi:hypothetical protein